MVWASGQFPGTFQAHSTGLVSQWITRLTTDQKIPGSNPGELVAFFFIDYIFIFIRSYDQWYVLLSQIHHQWYLISVVNMIIIRYLYHIGLSCSRMCQNSDLYKYQLSFMVICYIWWFPIIEFDIPWTFSGFMVDSTMCYSRDTLIRVRYNPGGII